MNRKDSIATHPVRLKNCRRQAGATGIGGWRLRRVIFWVVVMLVARAAPAATATFTIPYVTGHPDTQPFAGHPGWVDAYAAGNVRGTFARVDEEANFSLPESKKDEPLCLIAMFDKIETPPVIIPGYRNRDHQEVLIPTEYACAPAGYPDAWKDEYMMRGKDFFQVIEAGCTQLYGVSVFDGPKFVEWGNKINVSVHKDSPRGELIMVTEAGEGPSEHVSSTHSDFELPRIGWRHGDMALEAGRSYAIRVGAYRHGGPHFRLDAFVRPDKGDGYADGSAFVDGRSLDGDLCCLVFGNGHGQLVENHIRSEEWELFIPHYRPSTCWGQSFVAHGVSLAGISFWAATGTGAEPVECDVRLHPDGPWERPIGPVKTAVNHPSPVRPKIRYPEQPSQVEGCANYYTLPSQLYQVAYMPDEMALEPGKTYYIEVIPRKPVMMYADGDYYADGYAYYERLKVDRAAGSAPYTFHSQRWTLAMNIVTYANKGGTPLSKAGAQARVR